MNCEPYASTKCAAATTLVNTQVIHAYLTPLVTIKQVRAAGQQTCLNKHRPQVLLHLFTQLSQIAGSKDSM
jgi:hypothetical protein